MAQVTDLLCKDIYLISVPSLIQGEMIANISHDIAMKCTVLRKCVLSEYINLIDQRQRRFITEFLCPSVSHVKVKLIDTKMFCIVNNIIGLLEAAI